MVLNSRLPGIPSAPRTLCPLLPAILIRVVVVLAHWVIAVLMRLRSTFLGSVLDDKKANKEGHLLSTLANRTSCLAQPKDLII